MKTFFFQVVLDNFKKIPNTPISYWVSPKLIHDFEFGVPFSTLGSPKQGMSTCDISRFVKQWFEVSLQNTNIINKKDHNRWIVYNKGGGFRRWYGNREYIVLWNGNGDLLRKNGAALRNQSSYFQSFIAWTKITSTMTGFRHFENDFLFDGAGGSFFVKESDKQFYYLGFLNSNVCVEFLNLISPTLNFNENHIGSLPIIFKQEILLKITSLVKTLISISRTDWDSFETSWDFQGSPLLAHRVNGSVEESYNHLRAFWKEQTEEMRRLEIENNRLFIEAYGLQDELLPEVPWNEITLLCNPWYRYKGEKEPNNQTNSQNSDTLPYSEELEAKLLEDTMKDFLSYAVGCMMGRYSLDQPGLAIADQVKWEPGKTNIPDWILESEDPNPSAVTTSFPIDQRGIVPFLDDDWFANDVTERFKVFLKVTFGEENFLENLKFIEKALGKSVRKYFTKDFYKDHLRRYKNRPIYWMFSSSKGTFNVLVYMHRCTRHTGDWILNEYLRDFILKLRTHRDYLAQENSREDLSTSDKTRNFKQIAKYSAMLSELEEYESNVMYPIALEKIEFDLDDGVKVNYAKYGKALRKIPGLDAKEE